MEEEVYQWYLLVTALVINIYMLHEENPLLFELWYPKIPASPSSYKYWQSYDF